MRNTRYYFKQLTAREQQAYYDLEKGVRCLQERIDTIAFADGVKSYSHIADAFRKDNPESYYFAEMEIEYNDAKGVFIPHYRYSREQINTYNRQISAKAGEILSHVVHRAGKDNICRERELYRYFVEHYQYDKKAKRASNKSMVWEAYCMLGAILYGRAVCGGFSMAYKYLLNAMDIDCICVDGSGRSMNYGEEVSHMWNIVRHNGRYYHTDVTWGVNNGNPNAYIYLDLCERSIRRDHFKFSGIPSCPCDDLEYYRTWGICVRSRKELEDVLTNAMTTRKQELIFQFDETFRTGGESGMSSMVQDTINIIHRERRMENMEFQLKVNSEQGVYVVKFTYGIG